MKHKLLRSYMNRVSKLRKCHTLKNCNLVIDGRTYFGNNIYKKSGCQYILGGEYDRFANHLKKNLSHFIRRNITCYVVFNAAVESDIERRTKGFQTKLDIADSVEPSSAEDTFCEPLFNHDVVKEVLNELGIAYFVSEYNSTEVMIHMAKTLRCPLLTNNFQYAVYGVDTIEIQSLEYDNENNSIECKGFCKNMCNGFMPRGENAKRYIFMALVEELGSHFDKVLEVFGNKNKFPIHSVLQWVKNEKSSNSLLHKISQMLDTDEKRTEFLKLCDDNAKLFQTPPNDGLAVQFIKDKTKISTLEGYKNWMERGVACGRIATSYVNLKHRDTFTGTWQIVDNTLDEAMLPAMDIVLYVHSILNNSNKGKITFIGRRFSKAEVWEMQYDLHMNNHSLFSKGRDLFKQFILYYMPGFNFTMLEKMQNDCWLLIIALVYYCKRNNDFDIAKSVLLSHVMLGQVTEKCGLIKRSHLMFDLECDDNNDHYVFSFKNCKFIADELMNLFYIENAKKDFDRSLLHPLVEFQICLQHMNNLNRLCGESIPCSVYYKLINSTFIYNVYRVMKQDRDHPMQYFEKRLNTSPIFGYYKRLICKFEDVYASVQ